MQANVGECNPNFTQTKIQKGQFLLPFFFVKILEFILIKSPFFQSLS